LNELPDFEKIDENENLQIWEPRELSHLPTDTIGWVDMLVGGLYGFYVPMWGFSRDYDCFSRFAGISNSIMTNFVYFDKAYTGDWFETAIIIGVSGGDIANIYFLIDVCIAQLATGKELGYIE
jgi:hypothetical protein